MAAFNRPTQATYEVHENITVNTQDNEDHTFCGIMFPVKCKDLLPLDHLVVKSVAVRGKLGPMTVWVSNESQHKRENGQGNRERISMDPKHWTKIYENTLRSSQRTYKDLVLDTPIRLAPGETRVIYIHSTRPGDEAIVYDNTCYGDSSKRFEDDKLAILTGRAHVSTEVFGTEPIWGWGDPWRDGREFVGRLKYGTVYKLWNPFEHLKFGGKFKGGAEALFLCQRRWESPMSMLPDVCIYYILNMCRWDWFDDNTATMLQRRRKAKARIQRQEEEAKKRAAEGAAEGSGTGIDDAEEGDSKPAALSYNRCSSSNERSDAEQDSGMNGEDDDDDDDDEDYIDAHEDEVEEDDDDDLDNEDEDDRDPEEWSDYDDDDHRGGFVSDWEYSVDSDDSDDEPSVVVAGGNLRASESYRRHIQRMLVLRALASLEDGEVANAGR